MGGGGGMSEMGNEGFLADTLTGARTERERCRMCMDGWVDCRG